MINLATIRAAAAASLVWKTVATPADISSTPASSSIAAMAIGSSAKFSEPRRSYAYAELMLLCSFCWMVRVTNPDGSRGRLTNSVTSVGWNWSMAGICLSSVALTICTAA
ncbi:Uncharacterised protein [Mycobacteroides abscessus subsp. abscessus]|nr:Uncharacterised protein [Mycobacteroides abscessus subsp. abscessus]